MLGSSESCRSIGSWAVPMTSSAVSSEFSLTGLPSLLGQIGPL